MALGMEVDLGPGHIVLGGRPSSPSQERGQSPQFLLWPNGWMHEGATWCGGSLGLSPGDFVLDGDPAPLPTKGRSPQFWAHVYCGQTAAWIKMPLGTKVGLGLRDIVLDRDPAPPALRGLAPNSEQCPLWPNG